MNKDWQDYKVRHTNIEGSRASFEKDCGTLFTKKHPNKNVRIVEVNQGDGGIDIFIGEIGINPITVIQCKFFLDEFGSSQQQQIRNSFKTAIESSEYKMDKWILAIPYNFDLSQNKWWSGWKNRMIKQYNLARDFINLNDGDNLIDLFKEEHLYNQVFQLEDSIKIKEIHENLIQKLSLSQLENSIQKSSLFLSKIKNYFEKDPTTHIERMQTNQIVDWVKSDLKHPQKNILILEGDKGLGKSVILKDVYEILNSKGYFVLGIKADKYYAKTPKELENKIFLNENISFSNIVEVINTNEKQLIVIIDQLDALSQTLSSNREYIQTYNRVINELIDEKNIRIIISSRTYDLKYDVELSIYKSNEYKNIKATLLSETEVTDTLRKFNVSCSVKKVVELLRTPNHLEIFCKLPNKGKVNLNALSSLKDLYDELWDTLVLSQQDLQLDKVLFKIADEMYKQQQIVVRKQFVSKFNSELNYLFSNQLLTIENSNIQFFHQTFYDYCFARQFVENGNDIYTYLNQNQQNLEIRSIIKMVFEYLREYDHKKYIKYTKKILKSSKYRFHIKYLIINNLGLVSPSNDEKKLLQSYILNKKIYEDVFINSVFSKKWVEYLIEFKIVDQYLFIKKNNKNRLYDIYKKQSLFHFQLIENLNLSKIIEYKSNAIWMLLRNNINNAPYQIVTHLDNLPSFSNKDNFIERILYSLDKWEDKRMLPYFHKYLPFNEKPKSRDDFWSYQIIAKIFEYHPDYVFKVIKPIFINIFNTENDWFGKEFTHEQEELYKKMQKLNSKDSFQFLLNIYTEILFNKVMLLDNVGFSIFM